MNKLKLAFKLTAVIYLTISIITASCVENPIQFAFFAVFMSIAFTCCIAAAEVK